MTIHPDDPLPYLRAMLRARRSLLALALIIGPAGCCGYATIGDIARIEAELAWRALVANEDAAAVAPRCFPAMDTTRQERKAA